MSMVAKDTRVGSDGIWVISLPSCPFCNEPKSVQKNKVYLKDDDDDDDDDDGGGGDGDT